MLYSIREANIEIKGCCEAAETGARASFPGVTQPAPSAPPARSQYTSARKKHGEDCKLSAAAADSSASLTSGSSPARGVRRRAVATACADSRSPARPGASLRPSLPRQDRLTALPQPAPQSAGSHDRTGSPSRRDQGFATARRGRWGKAGPSPRRANRRHRREGAPGPPLSGSGAFRRFPTSSLPAAAALQPLPPAPLLVPGAARSSGPWRGGRRRFPTGETWLLRSLAACWVTPLPTRT